jgi:magnesium chelatase family protein
VLNDSVAPIGHLAARPCGRRCSSDSHACPCGFRGDRTRACTCPAHRLDTYGQRLSGPLLDRIDLRIEVPRLTPRERRGRVQGESSALVRERVALARQRQRRRFAGAGITANAHLSGRGLRELCRLEPAALAALDRAYETLRLSARACDRATKVAQSIADLEGADVVTERHVLESLSYRDAVMGRS